LNVPQYARPIDIQFDRQMCLFTLYNLKIANAEPEDFVRSSGFVYYRIQDCPNIELESLAKETCKPTNYKFTYVDTDVLESLVPDHQCSAQTCGSLMT